MEMVNNRRKHDPNTLQLERPLMRWENDALLALHEANMMIATGRTSIRPLEEVADADHEWETDVGTEYTHLKWLEDYFSLDPKERESLEKEIPE